MSIHPGFVDLTNSRRGMLLELTTEIDAMTEVVSNPELAQAENLEFLKRVDLFAGQSEPVELVNFSEQQKAEIRIESPPGRHERGQSGRELRKELNDIAGSLASISLRPKGWAKEMIRTAVERRSQQKNLENKTV